MRTNRRKASRAAGTAVPREWVHRFPSMAAAKVTRLIVPGDPPADDETAEAWLLSCLRSWPVGRRSKFLLLPGGYLAARFPRRWRGRVGWNTTAADVAPLFDVARASVHRVLSHRVLRAAEGKVDAVAIGVDAWTSDGPGARAELVAICELSTGKIHMSGKSLLRSDQRRVVRIPTLETHFCRVAGERALLLGCHDLNFFNPRGRGRQRPDGVLAATRKEMDAHVRTFRPTVVLHLPHGTDTPRTWAAGWKSLLDMVPSIKGWASGISYFRVGQGGLRASLDAVVNGTRDRLCADIAPAGVFENV